MNYCFFTLFSLSYMFTIQGPHLSVSAKYQLIYRNIKSI